MIRFHSTCAASFVVLLSLSQGAARAQPYTLSTGAGNGGVTVGVDGFGTFGTNPGANSTDATYQPITPPAHAPVGSIYSTGLALGIGGAGPRNFLSSGLIGASGGLPNPVVTGTATTGTSTFVDGPSGLSFNLVQTMAPMFNGAARTGSILTQTYTITNPTAAPITFDLVRYMDSAGVIFFGNHFLASNGTDVLYSDQNPINPLVVGLTGVGGTPLAANRWEIKHFPPVPAPGPVILDILAGTALTDAVGPPAQPYNVTEALRNLFTLAPGTSTVYTTQTIWGNNVAAIVPTIPAAPPPSPSPSPGAGGEGSFAGATDPGNAGQEGSFGVAAGLRTEAHATPQRAAAVLAGPYLEDNRGGRPTLAPAGFAAASAVGSRLRVYNVCGQVKSSADAPQVISTPAGTLGLAVLASVVLATIGALVRNALANRGTPNKPVPE